MIMTNDNKNGFSENALKLINSKSSRIAAAHFTGFLKNPYSKECNPDGFISLSIAENLLSVDILKEKLENQPFKQEMIQYSEFGGVGILKESIIKLYETKILKSPSKPILPEQICVGAGCTPLVENLFQTFCNPGEIAIIPSPLYSSFEYDAFARFGVKIVQAPMEIYNENENGGRDIKEFKIQISVLDRLYQEHGSNIKMILICNPNNPTGHIISREEQLMVINWAREKSIHVVSDEIYALSIFSSEASSKFESIYDVVNGELGNYIHILSGFSKDFCLNGLRCGYIISQNENLMKYIGMTSSFYLCSNQVQFEIASMIQDEDYLNRYIKSNQNNLKEGYEFISSALKKHGIPFIPSSSGVFLILDLRKCLESNTAEGEIGIWDKLYDEFKIIINIGKSCKFEDSGYFRLIFSQPKNTIEVAVERISKFYQKYAKK